MSEETGRLVRRVASLAVVVMCMGLMTACAWYDRTFVNLPAGVDRIGRIDPLGEHLEKAPSTPGEEQPAQGKSGAGLADADKTEREGPPAELTLPIEACRATALEQNLAIRAVLVDPLAAAERVTEEEARFESVFSADVSYATTDTPTATTLSGSRAHQLRMETGVDMPLRTGGTLSFDLADRRTKTNNIFSTLNPAYENDLTVSISQPLLRNAGRRVSTHPIRLAVYEREVVNASTRLEIIRVLAAVDRVYWRLYAARRVLAVRKQDYDLARSQLDTAQRFVDAGERSQVEVVRAEAALARRLEGIITAENAVRDRQRELKRVLNRPDLPLGSITVIVPGTEPDPVRYDLAGSRLVDLALENRMELLELELQLLRDDSTIEYLRNQVLPLVTLDYAYNVNGLGESRWDSYDLLANRRFADHYVGVRLVVPIGNEAAKSQLRQAMLVRRKRLATKADRQNLIQQEVLTVRDRLEAAWQRILANRQSVLLAKRLLDTEQRQFEIGMNTSNDVLVAQTGLADAQSAEIEALAEYQIGLVDLAYATGTVLGSAKIRWQD